MATGALFRSFEIRLRANEGASSIGEMPKGRPTREEGGVHNTHQTMSK